MISLKFARLVMLWLHLCYLKELKAGHYFINTNSSSIVDLLAWHRCAYSNWNIISAKVPYNHNETLISTEEVLNELLPPDKYPEHYI